MVMRKLILTIGLVLLMPAAMMAVASDKTDAMVPVHQFVDGFSRGDLKAAVGACTDDASVIDDFPPHLWQSCGKWADDFVAVTKKEGITNARIVLGKPRHVDVSGDSAYIVVPVTLSYTISGKEAKLPSMFTASLRKEVGRWRISSWAWADL
jgi:ketosteroid isomerase-like protein